MEDTSLPGTFGEELEDQRLIIPLKGRSDGEKMERFWSHVMKPSRDRKLQT